MKATFKKENGYTGKVSRNRKENKFSNSVSALVWDAKDPYNPCHEAVITRFYWTDSRCYCCVWVFGSKINTSGGGWAGGYGYHKASAALAEALTDAGIVLDEDISGRGETAIENAVKAVAKAATGRRNIGIVRAHG